MTKNRHDCFKGKSACALPSRRVTLSFGLTRDFPVGCLLWKSFISPIRGSRQIFTTLPKASELCFFDDTPEAQKCEHSSSQLLGSPCERGSGAHFVGIKRFSSDWLPPPPFTVLNPWFTLPLSPTDKGSRKEGHLQRTGLCCGDCFKVIDLRKQGDVEVGFPEVLSYSVWAH